MKPINLFTFKFLKAHNISVSYHLLYKVSLLCKYSENSVFIYNLHLSRHLILLSSIALVIFIQVLNLLIMEIL